MVTVEVALLGTLEVRVGGQLAVLPGRRPAALLAMLALARGRDVSIDELAHGVWGDEFPERVKGSLQTYVARLRRVLGHTAIVTGPAGYRLDTRVVGVDLDRFAALVDHATDPTREGRVRAAELLDEALELWRGEPLGGLSDWIDRNERPALVERYLSTMEQRVDLWMDRGDHGSAIMRLLPLVELYPLRESLWVRLMTALRDAGRIAEALAHYEVVRQRLANDLGADPSPELRDLHTDLLTSGATVPGPGAAPTAPVPPRQLPGVSPGFVGRDRELTRMDDVVTPCRDRQVMVLHGPGGSGKTALAVTWGHRMAAAFPDGQLMVNLRGHGPGERLETASALNHLLRALGVSDAEIPVDIDPASALLRTTLAQRRVLIVLDDARTADQVRPLIPGGANLVVVTSRSELRGLVATEGAARIAVGPLPAVDAVRLLDRRLNMDVESSFPHDDLDELAALCGYLPVALAIAAERAGRVGAVGLPAFLDALRNRRERLAMLSSGSDVSADVGAVFDASYHGLDHETATMYRRLGLHTDTTVCVPTAAALMGVDLRRADLLLDRLAEDHLVEPRASKWYGMHDLVRAHATDLAHRVDSSADRIAAVTRARSWYLHSAENAARMVDPNPPRPLNRPPASTVEPQEFSDYRTALAWFADHRRGLRTVFDDVLADADVAMAAELAALIASDCDQRGAYDERVALFDRLVPLAEACSDDSVLARCMSARGIFHGRRGEHELALTAFERAREISVAAGDRDGELRAIYSAASTHEFLGRPDVAVPLMEQVVVRRRAEGDGAQLIQSRQKLAQTYRYAGRLDDADAVVGELLAECRADGNDRGAARALDTMAEIARDRGDLDEVERRYAEAGAIYSALGANYEGARVANELGKAQLALGRPERAADNFRHALEVVNALAASDTAEMNRADIEAALTKIAQKAPL